MIYDLLGTCITFVQPCLHIFGVIYHFEFLYSVSGLSCVYFIPSNLANHKFENVNLSVVVQ